jgi:hypothetical protein
MNKAQLAKSIGTLVRLQPPAEDAEGTSFDDEWLIADITESFVELENGRTHQRTRIALDGIYTFHDDANRTTASQRFGFLVLHAHLELRDAGIDVRPFPSPRQPARGRSSVPQQTWRAPESDGASRQTTESPALSVHAVAGTANVGGRLLRSADVVVENSGGPCAVVAYATLGDVAPSLPRRSARWEYYSRSVKGGHGQTVYSVATLEPPGSNARRVVKVRGEEMAMRERYEHDDELWFDVGWEFYLEDAGRLAKVLTCTSRVSLNEQRDGLLIEVRDTFALAVGQA